jgi:hypothetical protein
VRQLDQEYRQEHPETVDQHPEDDGRDRAPVVVYQLGPEPPVPHRLAYRELPAHRGTCLGQLTLAPLARVPSVQVLQPARPHSWLYDRGRNTELFSALVRYATPLTRPGSTAIPIPSGMSSAMQLRIKSSRCRGG